MWSAVNAVFFLAMAPLGLMAAELGTAGEWKSNAQHTAAAVGEARHDGEPASGPGHRGLRLSTDMQTLLDLHNDARCLHNADSLTWSNAVATSAKAQAQALSSSCGPLSHSSRKDRNGYGENLYLCAGSVSSCYTPAKLMAYLYENEIKDGRVADYGGHATQILWQSTTQLGCAEATCSKGSSTHVYVVCQYNPPGNYVGKTEREVDLPTGKNC